MESAGDSHTRLVGWGKIILPIIGIALFSSLFLFAKDGADTSDIPFGDIETLAREQRITAPEFSGVLADGSTLVVTAKSARPDSGTMSKLTILDLQLLLNGSDGSTLRVTAGEGEIDGSGQTISLGGLAQLETSSGYIMETQGLRADLINGEISSNGALEAFAPFGKISAGQITFKSAEGDQGQQMLFTQGVRLLYTPTDKQKGISE